MTDAKVPMGDTYYITERYYRFLSAVRPASWLISRHYTIDGTCGGTPVSLQQVVL